MRTWTRWGLREAKALVANAPQTLPLSLSEADAIRLMSDLTEAGATAEMYK